MSPCEEGRDIRSGRLSQLREAARSRRAFSAQTVTVAGDPGIEAVLQPHAARKACHSGHGACPTNSLCQVHQSLGGLKSAAAGGQHDHRIKRFTRHRHASAGKRRRLPATLQRRERKADFPPGCRRTFRQGNAETARGVEMAPATLGGVPLSAECRNSRDRLSAGRYYVARNGDTARQNACATATRERPRSYDLSGHAGR